MPLDISETPPTISVPDPNALRFGMMPDAGDAYLFAALRDGSVDTDDLRFRFTTASAQTLGTLALAGELDVSVLSLEAYARVRQRYTLLDCGARFGQGWGPMVVSGNPLMPVELGHVGVAVGGTLSVGFGALSLFLPEVFPYVAQPEHEILPLVAQQTAPAGLIAGEEQFTHQSLAVYNVVDLAAWWTEQTGLPLPLTVLAVRTDLGEAVRLQIEQAILGSLNAARDNPKSALAAAHAHARRMDEATTRVYIETTITDETATLSETGRRSLDTFLQRGMERGLFV